jgi:hypothetical protein
VIFGAERGLEEALDDLAVGKALAFAALARGDRRQLTRAGIHGDVACECQRRQRQQGGAREGRERAKCGHCHQTLPYSHPAHKTASRTPSGSACAKCAQRVFERSGYRFASRKRVKTRI